MEKNGIIQDLTGQKFGRLTVIGFAEKRLGRKYWKCECECGNIKNAYQGSLVNGGVKSCGCLRSENGVISVVKARKKWMESAMPKDVAIVRAVYLAYKHGAKRRGYEFLLSFEEFTKLVKSSCYYCGSLPSQFVKSRIYGEDFPYNGIDRVDNSKGYILDNCVSCCKTCNQAKLLQSFDEFTIWIKNVYEHLQLGDKP